MTALTRRPFVVLALACLLPPLLAACLAPPLPPAETPSVLPVATAAPRPTLTPTPPLPPGFSTNPDRPADPAARAVRGGPPVRLAPDPASPVISGLYFDAPLALLEEKTGADGERWFRTRLWGVLDGWISAVHITLEPSPPIATFWENQGPVPTPTAPPSAELTLDVRGTTNCEARLRSGLGTDWRVKNVVPAGTTVRVRAWQTDEEGHAWFSVTAGEASGWLYSGTVDLALAPAARAPAAAIAGKGMWLPQPLLEMADENQLVSAARSLGLTHIWLEAGSSAGGFYGRRDAARLLPAAHAAGLKVIAWLTTSLYNLPGDVELSLEAANYRTPDGQGFDGIAPDVEQNMGADDVKAYAEITRARLGDDMLMVGVVYPAGSWLGKEHPIHATLARYCNALAPMAYWSDERRAYYDGEAYWYVNQVIGDLQAVVGRDYPIHVIGQMYDPFGRNGAGQFSPTSSEVQAALRAGREGGAVGVSFFQWGTATPEEWAALRDFAW